MITKTSRLASTKSLKTEFFLTQTAHKLMRKNDT